MKNGLKIYQKEIFNDDFKKKNKRLRTVVFFYFKIPQLHFLKLDVFKKND